MLRSVWDFLGSDAAWAWVGRLAALVTVLGGGVWLFNRVRERRAKLAARGEYFSFHVPRPVQQTIQSLLDALNPQNMKMYLAGDWTDSQRMDAAMSLYKYLDTQIDERLRRRLEGFSSAWKFIVVNRGDRELADLFLESELEGVYVLQRNGAEAGSGVFKHRLPLGALRGGDKIDVFVWAWYGSASIWEEKDIRVTHPQGRVQVQFPRRAWFIPGGLVRLFARKPARWG